MKRRGRGVANLLITPATCGCLGPGALFTPTYSLRFDSGGPLLVRDVLTL
jgi:hypothetical protein